MNLPPVPANLERAAGWSWRLLVCAAAVLAVLGVLWYVRIIVLPVMIALTITPALSPVVRFVRSRLRLGRSAAAIALLAGLAVVAGLIAIVTTSVLAQYDELASSVSRAVNEITVWLEGEPFNLSLAEDLGASLADSWREASGYLVSGAQAGASLLGGLVLAVSILYFILRDGTSLWDWILRRFTPETRPVVDRAGRRAWVVLGGFVRGTALIAVVDASLIGIGLWMLGVLCGRPEGSVR
jgi:putative heme transporter